MAGDPAHIVQIAQNEQVPALGDQDAPALALLERTKTRHMLRVRLSTLEDELHDVQAVAVQVLQLFYATVAMLMVLLNDRKFDVASRLVGQAQSIVQFFKVVVQKKQQLAAAVQFKRGWLRAREDMRAAQVRCHVMLPLHGHCLSLQSQKANSSASMVGRCFVLTRMWTLDMVVRYAANVTGFVLVFLKNLGGGGALQEYVAQCLQLPAAIVVMQQRRAKRGRNADRAERTISEMYVACSMSCPPPLLTSESCNSGRAYSATRLEALYALLAYLTAPRSLEDVGSLFGWSAAKVDAIVLQVAATMYALWSPVFVMACHTVSPGQLSGAQTQTEFQSKLLQHRAPRTLCDCNTWQGWPPCSLPRWIDAFAVRFLTKVYVSGCQDCIGFVDGTLLATVRPGDEAGEKKGTGKLQRALYSGYVLTT